MVQTTNKQLEALRGQYDINLKQIHSLDEKIEQIKPELKACLKNQLDYYYALLQSGIDTRSLGLSWIIKTVWYLGGKINMQRFPKRLDTETTACLLEVRPESTF